MVLKNIVGFSLRLLFNVTVCFFCFLRIISNYIKKASCPLKRKYSYHCDCRIILPRGPVHINCLKQTASFLSMDWSNPQEITNNRSNYYCNSGKKGRRRLHFWFLLLCPQGNDISEKLLLHHRFHFLLLSWLQLHWKDLI